MESKNEIYIKNQMRYYFDALIKIEGFDINNILIDEKPYKIFLVYNISYKSLIHYKPFHIRFGKIDGFIRVYDGSRYSISLGSEKRDSIYNRIKYFISVKSGITYTISHNYAKINVDWYDSLPLQKIITFHNVITLIIIIKLLKT